MAIEKGTKLFFKNGTQTNYNGLEKKDAGTFYVTSDTHRLYLGEDLLSQAVVTVKTINDLSQDLHIDGQIAYVQTGNILCIYDSSVNTWAQLNPDTAIATLSQYVETNDGVTTVSTSIKENRGEHAVNAFQGSFKVAGENGIEIGSGDNGSTLKVGLQQLALANGENQVTLAVGKSNNKITIKGDGDTSVSSDESGITISTTANDYRVVGTTQSSVNHTGFTIGSETQGFSLNGTLHLEDKNHKGNTEDVAMESASIDPVISIGQKGNRSAHFANGEAVIDTYTQAEIQNKINEAKRQMNAMTYKGKLDSTKGLPTAEVQIGDTYMVAEAGVYIPNDNKKYPVGTLIVAKGTEDEKTGFITSNLGWDAVQASDTDTTYTLTGSAEDKAIILYSSTGAEQSLTIADDKIVTSAITTDAEGAPTLTIKHNAVDHTATTGAAIEQATGQTATLSYISAVSVNDQGHVTNVTTTTAKLLDTVNAKASWGIEDATGGVTLNFGITDSANIRKDDNLSLTSDSLVIQKSGADQDKKVSVDLVWGTF